MRHWICIVLVFSLLFALAGCGLSGGLTEADRIMEKYSSGGTVLADARICFTGQYSTLTLTVHWQGSAEDSRLTVSAPEELEGLTLWVKDGAEVSLQGTTLYTGHIGSYPQSPVTVLPYALSLWQTGYMADCTRDKKEGREALVTRQTDDDGGTLYTWFDRESSLPFFLEWVYNEHVVLSAALEDVTFTPSAKQSEVRKNG